MSRLNRKTVFGFAIGDIGGNLYFSLMGFVFIYFMTDRMGLSGTLAGYAMLVGRVWDAITDPIISTMSDRTKNRFGRRRPYMFLGAIMMFIFMYLLFSLPVDQPSSSIFIKATLLLCLLNTAYTMVNIPYSALQPELTSDYTDKTRLAGWRMAFAIIGTYFAVTGLPLATATSWNIMALVLGSVVLISTFITVFTVKEPGVGSYAKQRGVLRSYKEAFTNREFIPALLSWSLFVMGVTIIQQAFLYYFKYNFNNEGLFSLALFGLLTLALLFLPLWVKLAQKISKGQCYMLGMGFFSLLLILSYFLTPIFGGMFGVIIIVIGGIGFSTHYVMPHSIIPDIVELDVCRTGIRREGVYYSIWNFIMKLGQGIAALIIGKTLDFVGFIPSVTNEVVVQSQRTLDGIAFLCGPIAAVILFTGVIILQKYPINREYYQNVLNNSSPSYDTEE